MLPSTRTMNFGILIFPQVEELDFVGPYEMLTTWSQVAGGPEKCLVVAQSMAPVVCANGLSVNPHVDFETCPSLDYLLVPGGRGTRTEVSNPALIRFVQEQAGRCRAICSVCTGAFVLHAAGLLTGKKATTHWGSLDRLRALGDVQVVEDRMTRDGNVWCSAGVSAGMDLTLRLISDVSGEEAASMVQLEVEYYPEAAIYGTRSSQSDAPKYIRDARRF